MDKIVTGFLDSRYPEDGGEKLASLVRYNLAVKRINVRDDGVGVIYEDLETGESHKEVADYCVSNIPLPVLQQLKTNFSPGFQDAVDAGRFDPTCKVGWEVTELFWESNEYEIYGGISFTDNIITQMWYPSDGYFGRRGTITGLYNFGDNAIEFGNLGLMERLRVARQGAIRLHKEFENDEIVPEDLGLSIAWQHVPYQLGGWANWTDADSKAYTRLLEPDRRFYVVGDQASQLPGWQEGAMASAEHVVDQIAGIRPLTVKGTVRAPGTRRLVEGLC